jgi:hypothetical protein
MRRRDFLSKATAAGGAALLGSCLPPVIKTSSASPFGLFPTINVRNHGAVGNGIADDAAAIKAAQAALTNGATLYFPAGEYRFATPNPAGRAAITLAGLSFVTVKFDPGAKLVMDNLVGGKGTSHGIRIVGPAAYVNLVNPTIEWKTAPTYRSTGDGINVLGYPSFFPPSEDGSVREALSSI